MKFQETGSVQTLLSRMYAFFFKKAVQNYCFLFIYANNFGEKVHFSCIFSPKSRFSGTKEAFLTVKGQKSREIDDWTIYDLTNDLQF